MKTLKSLPVICICFSLVACSLQPQVVPTSSPPPPTATSDQQPTASSQPPTATDQPPATSSQPPTATNTLVVAGTPTGQLGPDNFPDNVNPLTGEVVADPQLLNHRPLAIKVVNEPSCSRPQFGLNNAAAVFEHYVEAWGTRLTAIFYGNDAERVGGVRSARLIDMELPAIFDALLVTSGSSAGVKQRLKDSDFFERIISAEFGDDCPPLCRVPKESVACQDLEHTMFTNTLELHAEAAKRGLETRPQLSGWTFSPQPLTNGEAATLVHVNFLNSPVDWIYEESEGVYLRSQDGSRHTDAATGARLSAANVVVPFANHLYSDIQESANFYSLEIQFWGQGPALLFRDGQMFRGLWLRLVRPGLFHLVDEAGVPLPLKPGRTWFEFVGLDSGVSAAEGEWTITAAVLPQQTPPRR